MKFTHTLRTTCGSALAIALAAGAAQAQDEDRSGRGDNRDRHRNLEPDRGAGRDRRAHAQRRRCRAGADLRRKLFPAVRAADRGRCAQARAASVTFLSDVIESDGARLRGLAPGYTQITINGERVPGSNADRSFFMDRIPAELVSRVEIVRSSSARRTGDADGRHAQHRAARRLRTRRRLRPRWRAATMTTASSSRASASSMAAKVGPGRILLGANLQGRHNPKLKESLRYGERLTTSPTSRPIRQP